LSYDFERIALIHKKCLSLCRIVHFLRVFRDERIEKGVEAFVVPAFGTEDTAESLGFLTTGAIVAAYLNEAGCFWKIDRCIADGREKDGLDVIVVSKIFENVHSFLLTRSAVDKMSSEVLGVHLQSIDVIGENNYFVTSPFVIVDEILASLESTQMLTQLRDEDTFSDS
jgi:hypothetical protein